MNSDFRDLLLVLNESRVEYLIVGGHAVMEYSEPRYTKDLDIWIWAKPDNAVRVFDALGRFGAPMSDVTPTDFEKEGYVFQIGIAPIRIDILMSIEGIAFEEAWPNRRPIQLFGAPSWVISKGDLIKNKRASGRPQDLIDADLLENI